MRGRRKRAITTTPSDTLLRRFETAAAATPAAVAVRTEQTSVTYGVLTEASQALAERLARESAGLPGPVAVLHEPGPHQICAALAAMRCGRPYLPIDLAYPRQRINRILTDAAPAAVFGPPDSDVGAEPHGPLGAGTLVDALPLVRGEGEEATEVDDRDAYVIYTSGSTGTPKGIVVPHCGIVNLLDEWAARRLIPPGSRYSTCASPGFDASILETWTCLTTGGELVVMPDAQRWHATRFVNWLSDQRIAHAYIPAPFLPDLAQALRLGVDLHTLQLVIVAVEPIPRGLLGEIKRALPTLTLLNGYGPTETSICSLVYEVTGEEEGQERTPIGTAIRNIDLRVEPTDAAAGEANGPAALPASDGIRGELHIGGVGVGRYLHPERVGQPAYYWRITETGGRTLYYRTGDLVHVNSKGVFTFLDRIDEMVKVRGYRVEPGDVEDALLQQPGVSQAVVVKEKAHPSLGSGSGRLVAYVVPASGSRLAPHELDERLRDWLPWYAVPHRIVVCGALPLTQHGKINRRALATHRPAMEAPYVPRGYQPQTVSSPGHTAAPPSQADGTALELRRLWNEVLGRSQSDPDMSFLANGGDSLAAGRLAAAVTKALGRRVKVLDVLLAADLDDLGRVVLSAPTAHPPAAGLRQAPLTSAQQGFLLEEQLLEVDGYYAESCLFPLPDQVPLGRLREAVTQALLRHPAIGARVREGDDLFDTSYLCLGEAVDLRMHYLDSSSEDTDTLTGVADRLRREPLDLHSGPLGRAHLISCQGKAAALLLTVHHIVCDTWSLQLLLADIGTAFTGGTFPGAPRATACDFAVAQRGALSKAAVARRAAVLAAGVPITPRTPSPSLAPPCVLRRTLPAGLTTRLRASAARADVTAFTAVCAGFELAVHDTLTRDPFLYVTPVARRDDPRFADVAGCLINVTPIAASVSPEFTRPGLTPGRLLAAVGEQVNAALNAADLPYPELRDALCSRDAHEPPHRRMVVLESPLVLRLAGKTALGTILPPIAARAGVHLSVLELGSMLDVSLWCDRYQIGEDRALALLDTFVRALETLAE